MIVSTRNATTAPYEVPGEVPKWPRARPPRILYHYLTSTRVGVSTAAFDRGVFTAGPVFFRGPKRRWALIGLADGRAPPEKKKRPNGRLPCKGKQVHVITL